MGLKTIKTYPANRFGDSPKRVIFSPKNSYVKAISNDHQHFKKMLKFSKSAIEFSVFEKMTRGKEFSGFGAGFSKN